MAPQCQDLLIPCDLVIICSAKSGEASQQLTDNSWLMRWPGWRPVTRVGPFLPPVNLMWLLLRFPNKISAPPRRRCGSLYLIWTKPICKFPVKKQTVGIVCLLALYSSLHRVYLMKENLCWIESLNRLKAVWPQDEGCGRKDLGHERISFYLWAWHWKGHDIQGVRPPGDRFSSKLEVTSPVPLDLHGRPDELARDRVPGWRERKRQG